MSYLIEKRVGNSTYLYETTSYWDPEKKQPRQKRVYLGKKDPHTGEAVRPRQRLPRLAKDYGNVYLLHQVADRIGLSPLLQRVFPADYRPLLALMFFDISEAQPLYLFPSWAEATALPTIPTFTSKTLTSFTRKLGQMEAERLEFSTQWRHLLGEVHAIVFDITSLSSYSALLPDIEWGYNRDHEKLPQLNLGILYAQHANLPVYYRLYPGSIRDVSTLKNLVTSLHLFAVQEILFVMDRGFYSATNLSHMKQAQLTFLIPLPKSVKLFSSLLSKHTRQLTNPSHSFLFQDEVLYHLQDSTTINTVDLQAHLYFNPQQRSDQTARFLKNILALEQLAKQQTFQTQKAARRYLSKQMKGASDFFRVTGSKAGQIDITRKPRTLARRMANMGTTIMLTNDSLLSPDTMLTLYRQKDYLEKIFDALKNEFDGKRLRGSTKDTVEGRVFLKFLALILYSAIATTMRAQHLFQQYSLRELMYELKKLRLVTMTDETSFLTEVSKRQREIFQKFDVNIPKLKT
jgi:transposase